MTQHEGDDHTPVVLHVVARVEVEQGVLPLPHAEVPLEDDNEHENTDNQLYLRDHEEPPACTVLRIGIHLIDHRRDDGIEHEHDHVVQVE